MREHRHRYTMSVAMRALAMWILGLDNEAIAADPLVVETQIALHAGETLLQFAVTEFFDRWSGEERSLAIGHPFKGWKVDVVGPDAVSRMSEKEKQAKRAVISGSQRIPDRERAILLGLFDYLSVLPESALVAAGVISVVDDAALEVVLGMLLDHGDADREAKVRRWVATLRQRVSVKTMRTNRKRCRKE